MLSQGRKLIKKNKEGFIGDVAPITSKLQAQNTAIDTTLTSYSQNITDFSGAFVNLKTKINSYFATATAETNKNVFVTPQMPSVPANAGGCYPTGSTFMTAVNDPSLTTYLTQTGITEQKADAACRMWAHDSGMPLYGIQLAGTGTGAAGSGAAGYTCSISSAATSTTAGLSQYAVDMSYTLMTFPTTGTYFAGLFRDGRFGLYDASQNTTFINPEVPSDLALCDPWFGGGINKDTLTADFGYNCNSNLSTLPIRYIVITSTNSPITIGQIEVWAIDANGANTNVAVNPETRVSASEAQAIPYEFLRSSVKPTKEAPIDGKCNKQCREGGRSKYECYLSVAPAGPAVYWNLDLGKEYTVNKLVFINNKDNTQLANNMTINLCQSYPTPIVIKKVIQLTSNLNQTYDMSV